MQVAEQLCKRSIGTNTKYLLLACLSHVDCFGGGLTCTANARECSKESGKEKEGIPDIINPNEVFFLVAECLNGSVTIPVPENPVQQPQDLERRLRQAIKEPSH